MRNAEEILSAIRALPLDREVRLMEVCGTHTMAIAASGIRNMLPERVKLLSGPGCPVCVTPPEEIDAFLGLSMRRDVIIATYGDMIRVPGNGNHSFKEEMVTDELISSARHLHLASANVLKSLDGKPLGRLFERAHAAGLTTSLDASYDREGNWMKNIEDALHHCDIFIPSMQEAAIYAGTDDPEEICRMFSKYPLQVFGIKLGEKGVLVTDFHETWTLPSLYKGIPVDTTGAGDAFLAGFVSAWLKGYDIPSSAYAGSAQAYSVLGAAGANTSAGTWEDAVKLLGDNQITLRMR